MARSPHHRMSGLYPTPCAAEAVGRWQSEKALAQGWKETLAGMARKSTFPQSSPVGSLANLIPLQESVRRLLTIVTSGPRLPVSFARFDRDGSSGRMFAVSSTPNLDGSLAAFSGTWPTWGIALDGACGELPTLERCTSANESSSWPTPTTRDHKDGSAKACGMMPEKSLLGRAIHLRWPTPQANDVRDRGNTASGAVLRRQEAGKQIYLSQSVSETSGALNPTWVEWLMGFPLGWTALEPSETPSSRSKRSRSSPKSQGSSE
jgi:hypothetical protein